MDVPTYVMVPVPEQLVPDVMRNILVLMAKESMQPWDQASLDEYYGELDEMSKTILSLAARGTAAGKTTTADDMATSCGLPLGEMMNRLRTLNVESDTRKRPAIVPVRVDNEVLDNGREVRRRFVEMNDAVAQMVITAENAERDALPHHLQGTE
jgi:hypothetical protein